MKLELPHRMAVRLTAGRNQTDATDESAAQERHLEHCTRALYSRLKPDEVDNDLFVKPYRIATPRIGTCMRLNLWDAVTNHFQHHTRKPDVTVCVTK